MYRVVLSGYYGFGNAGDEAILTSVVGALRREVPEVQITVLSAKPWQTASAHGVRAVNRFNPFQVAGSIARGDLLLSGGGGLLQDVTSVRSLLYYLGVICTALLLGKPVMLYANGLGPIRTAAGRLLTRAVLNRVDLITLRDARSREELEGIGVRRPPVFVTADPALLLAPAERDRVEEILAAEGIRSQGRRLAGISVRRWGEPAGFLDVVARAADHVADAYGLLVILVPMQFPEDYEICTRIRDRMRSEAHVLAHNYEAAELLALFSRFEIVLAMRLHALIFCVLQGVPLVGIAYDPKVESFLHDLGQPAIGAADCLSLELLKAGVDRAWVGRAAMREELGKLRARLQGLARKNAELAAALLRSSRRREAG